MPDTVTIQVTNDVAISAAQPLQVVGVGYSLPPAPPLTVPVTVAAGGTGSSTAAGARANLGVPQVFSPLAYGAAGNGTTDDTAAVRAAFTAAAAAGGTVDLGTGNYLTSSAIALASNVTVRGAVVRGGASSNTGALVNNTGNLFTVTGTVQNVTFANCALVASAGHVFSCAAGAAVSGWNWHGAGMTVTGTGYSIWSQASGATYISMFVGGNCLLQCANGATVPAWNIVSSNNACNLNAWENSEILANAPAGGTVPFFRIENQGSGGYNSDNNFRNLDCEEVSGGILTALSATCLTIDNVAAYDTTTFSGHLFSIGTGAGSNRSGYITIRNSGRRGGSLGSGVYDVSAASNVVSLILENVGPETGTGSYSVPVGATTILGGVPLATSHLWVPADNGWVIANGILDLAGTISATLTAGTLYLFKWKITTPVTIGNLVFLVNTGGSGTSSGSYAGLYSSAGTLLSGSSDIAASFTNPGWTNPALTTPQALGTGTTVWAALLLNIGTTMPKIYAFPQSASNLNSNLSAASFRFAVNGTGLTSLPASVTPSSNATSGAVAAFCGGY